MSEVRDGMVWWTVDKCEGPLWEVGGPDYADHDSPRLTIISRAPHNSVEASEGGGGGGGAVILKAPKIEASEWEGRIAVMPKDSNAIISRAPHNSVGAAAKCMGCFNEINEEVCWCGDFIAMHGALSGHDHSPVPDGCTCGYVDPPRTPRNNCICFGMFPIACPACGVG